MAGQDPLVLRKSFVGVVSYALGAVSAWFSVRAAFVLYLITPLFFIVPPRARQAAQPGTAREIRTDVPRRP